MIDGIKYAIMEPEFRQTEFNELIDTIICYLAIRDPYERCRAELPCESAGVTFCCSMKDKAFIIRAKLESNIEVNISRVCMWEGIICLAVHVPFVLHDLDDLWLM